MLFLGYCKAPLSLQLCGNVIALTDFSVGKLCWNKLNLRSAILKSSYIGLSYICLSIKANKVAEGCVVSLMLPFITSVLELEVSPLIVHPMTIDR